MKYILLVVMLFLSACSLKNYTHSSSKLIVIKTAKLKFADLGYVKNSAESVRLELFIAGSNVQNIEINHLICLNEGCMRKASFNAEYLNENYPDTILQNITLGNPIYNEQKLKKTSNGFEQKIKNKAVDIIYKVSSNEIYFKDKKNEVLFKIKDIK